jgi:hypothetical protein
MSNKQFLLQDMCRYSALGTLTVSVSIKILFKLKYKIELSTVGVPIVGQCQLVGHYMLFPYTLLISTILLKCPIIGTPTVFYCKFFAPFFCVCVCVSERQRQRKTETEDKHRSASYTTCQCNVKHDI